MDLLTHSYLDSLVPISSNLKRGLVIFFSSIVKDKKIVRVTKIIVLKINVCLYKKREVIKCWKSTSASKY